MHNMIVWKLNKIFHFFFLFAPIFFLYKFLPSQTENMETEKKAATKMKKKTTLHYDVYSKEIFFFLSFSYTPTRKPFWFRSSYEKKEFILQNVLCQSKTMNISFHIYHIFWMLRKKEKERRIFLFLISIFSWNVYTQCSV